ncbi:MAG: AsmA family protein [Rhodobacterales bacterium]|nr:MAG: AsmA family protein [Rhodobacterales bacterium]
MRFVIRSIIVLVLLVIIAIGTLLLLPGDKIARFAEGQFESATGRAISIGGEVKTTIYPLLGVRTGAIRIANAPWSKSGPMVQAEGMSIGVDLTALFTGDIRIKKIDLQAPKILLEVAQDGRANWEMGKTASAGSGAGAGQAGDIPAFSLDRALIKNGTLTYLDHGSGGKTSLSEMDIDLRLPEFAGRADLALSARMNGQTVSVKGDVAQFATLLEGGITGVKATVKNGANVVKFNGKAGMSPPAADGNLEASLKQMPTLFKLLGMAPVELDKGMGRSVVVNGKVTYTGQNTAHLRDGVIKLDQNVFSGGVDYLPGKARPMLKAQFAAGALDFSSLAASVDSSGQTVEVAPGWSKERIDVSALGLMDADIHLVAKSVNLGTVKLGPSNVHMKLDRARAVFGLKKISTYQGQLAGQFVVNGRRGLSVGGDLTLSNIAMQPLLRDLADYDRLMTGADMQLKFLGVGNSMSAIMHSLSGSGSFTLGRGEILGLDLAGMLRNLDASYRGKGQKTVFDKISASFSIKGGVLSNNDLAFDAKKAKAVGAGTVGIGDQTLNYRITPTVLAKTDGSGGISVPVIISGSWSNPKFRPDLQGLIDKRLAEEKAALKAKLEAEKAAKKAELKAKLAAEKARALRKAEEKLSIDLKAGESLEDAARRKLEEEAKKGLGKLLKGN